MKATSLPGSADLFARIRRELGDGRSRLLLSDAQRGAPAAQAWFKSNGISQESAFELVRDYGRALGDEEPRAPVSLTPSSRDDYLGARTTRLFDIWRSWGLDDKSGARVSGVLRDGRVFDGSSVGIGNLRAELVRVRDGEGREIAAVMKRKKNEPDWFVKQRVGGCLVRREAAAYEVDRLLGFGLVPPTVLRQLDDDLVSLQQFIASPAPHDYDAISRLDLETAQKLVVFDYLIDNPDRSNVNLVMHEDAGKLRLAAIDNGYSFRCAGFGEPPRRVHSYVGSRWCPAVRDAIANLDPAALARTLEQCGVEKAATTAAVERLLRLQNDPDFLLYPVGSSAGIPREDASWTEQARTIVEAVFG